jgi:hypothetical protein
MQIRKEALRLHERREIRVPTMTGIVTEGGICASVWVEPRIAYQRNELQLASKNQLRAMLTESMKCQDLLKALNAYVDGEIPSALCRALQEHLADCTPCRIVVDNLRQTITLYRAGEETPLPPGLHEQLRAAMRQRWTSRFPVSDEQSKGNSS